MNRVPNGIDRQRTNMYWPEEENSPSVYEYSPSRNIRRPSSRESSSRTSSISYDSQNGLFDDVNTREMVRKQQESKIQFYDYDDSNVPPTRTITPSSVCRNLSRESPEADLSHRKLETLKSRIEFYDFVDEGAPKAQSTPRSRMRESEPRSPEVPAVHMSRDSNSARETYAPEDRTDGRSTTTNAKSTRTINHGDYSDTQKSAQTRRVPIEITHRRQQSPEQEKSRAAVKARDPPAPRSVASAKKQLSSSVIDLSTLDLDDPELEELKKLKPPSKTDIHKKLATFETTIRSTNSRSTDNSYNSPPQTRVQTPSTTDHAEKQHRDNQVNGMRHVGAQDDRRRDGRNRDPIKTAAVVVANGDPEPPNEARRMAHRHLQSSFSFGGAREDNNNNNGGRRPCSIRDSAVCRVGVGLPDL